MENFFNELQIRLMRKGYPFQPYQDYWAFLSIYRLYTPVTSKPGSHEISTVVLEKTLNGVSKNIINDMHAIRLKHLLNVLQKSIKTNNKIILQADMEYIQGIEKYLGVIIF